MLRDVEGLTNPSPGHPRHSRLSHPERHQPLLIEQPLTKPHQLFERVRSDHVHGLHARLITKVSPIDDLRNSRLCSRGLTHQRRHTNLTPAGPLGVVCSFSHATTLVVAPTLRNTRHQGEHQPLRDISYLPRACGRPCAPPSGPVRAGVRKPAEKGGGGRARSQPVTFDRSISRFSCLLYTSPSPRDRQKS